MYTTYDLEKTGLENGPLMNVVSAANGTWTWSVSLRSKVEDKPADQPECCAPGHQNVLQQLLMLGNGDSPPCIPKHVSCVEAICLLMPSTCLVCSSDVCSAFYFLRAVFEMLHGLQKGLSTADVVALQLWHHITSHNQGAKAKVKKNQHPSLSFVLGSFWAFCYCRIALLAHVQYTYTMCSDSRGFVWFEISVKTGSLISACAYLIWLDEFDLCWCSPAYLPNLPVEPRDISQHYVVRSILDL